MSSAPAPSSTTRARRALAEAARRHGVQLTGNPIETPWAIGCVGERGAAEVYVKVTRSDSDERLAGRLLQAWRGAPVVGVVATSECEQILDRIVPGTLLEATYAELGDAQSLAIIGGIATALRERAAPDLGFPTMRVRGRALREGERPTGIDASTWRKAVGVYVELADSARSCTVVHGDLHHANVLFDRNRGWLAIDPKGVIGDLEYELACALRNPIAQVTHWAAPDRVAQRVAFLASTVGADAVRLLRWAFAQSVLAAAWDVEDGYDHAPWLLAAGAYEALL